MFWLYYLLLLLAVLGCLVLVAMTMPGLWLMTAAAAIYAIVTHERFVGWKTLLALALISLLAEIVELYLGGAAAKKAGGGKRAMIGGVLGGILGGIFLSFLVPIFIVGTVLGICLGSFIGAAAFEWIGGEKPWHSVRVGYGAAKGRFMGIVCKLVFGTAMGLVILVTALPIGGSPRTTAIAVPSSATHP